MTRKTLRSKFTAGRGYTREEWDEVSDHPEITDEQIAEAKPFAEAFPDLMESIKRSRGRPRVAAPRAAVTLRLDPATLARFQATGKDWRQRMAKVLDKAKV